MMRIWCLNKYYQDFKIYSSQIFFLCSSFRVSNSILPTTNNIVFGSEIFNRYKIVQNVYYNRYLSMLFYVFKNSILILKININLIFR